MDTAGGAVQPVTLPPQCHDLLVGRGEHAAAGVAAVAWASLADFIVLSEECGT